MSLQVDDENKNDIEEDEAELLVDAAAATNAATAAAVEGADEDKPAAPDKKKSVRVVVEGRCHAQVCMCQHPQFHRPLSMDW